MTVKSYPFTTPGNYTYDSNKIEVAGGLGKLKRQTLVGWNYRKSHVINQATGAGSNYQVKIVVHYGSGSDSGENVYMNSKCKTDFSDIRFTDDDGITELGYWREAYIPSSSATFWVKVNDDLGVGNQTIYIHYGNVAASTTSDITTTMLAGDDSLNWNLTYYTSGTSVFSHSGGLIHTTGGNTSDDGWVMGVVPPSGNFFSEVKSVITGTSSTNAAFLALGLIDDSAVNTPEHSSVWNPKRRFLALRYGANHATRANKFRVMYWDTLGNPHWWNGSAWQGTAVYLLGAGSYYIQIWDDGVNYNLDILDDSRVSQFTTPASIPKASVKAFSSGRVLESSEPYTDVYFVNALFDNWYERKYTYPEPTHSTWGSEETAYVSDKPTIEPTILFDPVAVISWDIFQETLGGGNEGSIGYNLYKVDKANKYWWNGAAWVVGGSSSNFNSAAVINANIGTFDPTPDKIGFVAYLVSNGLQKVELDEIQITYSANFAPSVDAGTNKTCYDHESKKPFSDCSFSDPDGTVDHAYYDIEGSGWIEIPKGGWATLLEAVQAFTYVFDNIGAITCNLKVEDNLGATAEDSMTMTVSKYTVTFNVKDSQGYHLQGISVNFGDGGGWHTDMGSPFTHDFDYSATDYEVYFDKSGYTVEKALVPSTIHTENITLSTAGLTDWTTDERKQIRDALGVDGNKEIAVSGQLQNIKAETNKIQPEIINKKNEFKANVSALATSSALTAHRTTVEPNIDTKISTRAADVTVAKEITLSSHRALTESAIEFIKQIEGGRWKIINNQMIFYKNDNTTVIATFNLFDISGNPAMANVFERKRI